MLAQTVYEILAPPPTYLSFHLMLLSWKLSHKNNSHQKWSLVNAQQMTQKKRGKESERREPEKAKSKSQDCCVTSNPKMKLQNFAFYAYPAHMDYGISYHCPRASTHTWSYFIVLKPGYEFSPHVWGPCSVKLHNVFMLIKICTTLLL